MTLPGVLDIEPRSGRAGVPCPTSCKNAAASARRRLDARSTTQAVAIMVRRETAERQMRY
jgi:hypothetical protein